MYTILYILYIIFFNFVHSMYTIFQFYIFNVYSFSKNVYNSVYTQIFKICTKFFILKLLKISKNVHNLIHSWYTIFQKEKCSQLYTFNVHNLFFLKNMHYSAHPTCTNFQKMYIILYEHKSNLISRISFNFYLVFLFISYGSLQLFLLSIEFLRLS